MVNMGVKLAYQSRSHHHLVKHTECQLKKFKFIYAFNRYLLSLYWVLGTVLGAFYTIMNKRVIISALLVFTF